ncbi:unnamed protein product [Lampetra planeri]
MAWTPRADSEEDEERAEIDGRQSPPHGDPGKHANVGPTSLGSPRRTARPASRRLLVKQSGPMLARDPYHGNPGGIHGTEDARR